MLAIVPARGGSKGIPNKCLRLLHGKPLLLHICDTLRQVPAVEKIVVTTDSDEIATVANLHGYDTIRRPAELAQDEIPIGPVAAHASAQLGWRGPVGIFQPTCPLISAQTITEAYDRWAAWGYDSCGFVTPETHLLWDDLGPLYESRVNRQELNGQYRELGVFFTRQIPIGPETMDPIIGPLHLPFVVPDCEAVDIDTHADLETARRALGRKTIEFRAAASKTVGSGHLRRCLQLAEELSHHDVVFRFQPQWPRWARDLVAERGWENRYVDPDVVIFDRLDTSINDVASLRAHGTKVVTLEDLGPGSDLADLVVNELYDDRRRGVLSGPRWAVLRPEFVGLPPFLVRDSARTVLVVFGGTDPANLSGWAAQICALESDVKLLVGSGSTFGTVVPLGVEQVSGSVAAWMSQVDLVVTSAGRMAHEAAAVGVPCVTVAVNERESRHSHCPGILRLGLWASLPDEALQETVRRLLASPELRAEMSATSRAAVDGRGGRRIAQAIEALLEDR